MIQAPFGCSAAHPFGKYHREICLVNYGTALKKTDRANLQASDVVCFLRRAKVCWRDGSSAARQSSWRHESAYQGWHWRAVCLTNGRPYVTRKGRFIL